MSISRQGFLVFCSIMIIVAFTACKKEGPAERAGKSIDQSVEKAEKQLDKTTEKAGEKIEEAGKKLKESVK